MDLNTFGSELIKHTARIANAAEGIEAHLRGTKADPKGTPKAEPKAESKPKAEPKPTAKKPTKTFDEVKAALVQVKDTIGKEEAQAIYQKYGYTAMSKVEEKDFDAVFADATAALEAHEAGGEGDEDL